MLQHTLSSAARGSSLSNKEQKTARFPEGNLAASAQDAYCVATIAPELTEPAALEQRRGKEPRRRLVQCLRYHLAEVRPFGRRLSSSQMTSNARPLSPKRG